MRLTLSHWAPALLVALFVALAAVPRLRRRALAARFLEEPPVRASRGEPVPYLGGVGLVLAALAGFSLEPRLGGQGALVLLAAAAAGTLGLLADDRRIARSVRSAGVGTAALVAVAAGVRIHFSGSVVLDVTVTVAWIAALSNAFDALDAIEGVAAGVATVASFAVFALAVLAGQPVVATLAAAIFGACLGVLLYNRPPAWIALGSTGRIFLGFILAVLTVEVTPTLPPSGALVVPLMVLGLPLLHLVVVTLRQPGRFPGPRPARVLLLWVAFEAGLATLAVLAGREVVPLWVATSLGALVVAAFARVGISGGSTAVQPGRVVPRGFRTALVALTVGLPVLTVPALLALVRAAGPARAGEALATQAVADLDGGNTSSAVAGFRRAAAQFAKGNAAVRGPLPGLGLVVPGLSNNLAATRTLLSVGRELSRTGVVLGEVAAPSRLPVRQGSVSLDEVRALTPSLSATSRVIEKSRHRIDDVQRGLLLSPVHRAIERLARRLSDNQTRVREAADAADLLPGFLGQDHPRRYFLAFQNNSELRGSGGFLGNWGELVAEGGRLRLERFGRLGELQSALTANGPAAVPLSLQRRWRDFALPTQWQQVNVSPDFPTTAELVDVLYSHSGGRPIDGVIAIDPVGLAHLLELTGPVQVSSWPEPITSANVVDVTLVQAYARYPIERDAERIQFLSDVARTVTEAFTKADLGNAAQLLDVLGDATAGGHLTVYSKDRAAEQLVTGLGVGGDVPPLLGDSLLVVNQNMAGNKLDTYLRRHIRYDLRLRPEHGTVQVSGQAAVGLTNALPSLNLPVGVVGPYLEQFRAGENRTYVSLYSPFVGDAVLLDGHKATVDSHFDLDRPSQSVVVSIDAGQTRTLSFPIKGVAELTKDGWYRLDLLRQPVLNADSVDVDISVPHGWRVADVRGAPVRGGRPATIHLDMRQAQTVWVRVEATGMNRLWQRLFG